MSQRYGIASRDSQSRSKVRLCITTRLSKSWRDRKGRIDTATLKLLATQERPLLDTFNHQLYTRATRRRVDDLWLVKELHRWSEFKRVIASIESPRDRIIVFDDTLLNEDSRGAIPRIDEYWIVCCINGINNESIGGRIAV